ncbi:MAG: hypothetical protein MJ252_05045 [archaeon]|nr:hypothetical protein [archaeon]
MSETNDDNNSTTTNTTTQKKKNLNETIQIYLRLRPTRDGTNNHPHLQIANDKKSIGVKVPMEDKGYVNNTIRKHTFKFDKIYDCPTTQEQIFDEVAKEVID